MVVERVDVPIAGLPDGLQGLTICHLADLHRGPRVTEAHVRRAADAATSLGADVIVVTGDFVSRSWRFAQSCAEALSTLRAPSGVFAVRGNHDYWAGDVDEVDRAMSRVGIDMLTNRAAGLRHHGDDWWLCGVDDVWSGRPDPRAALRGVPTGAFTVLLCHEPDYADTVAAMGARVPLLLCGHSHGGVSILPLRINCPPEVSLLRLQRA